MGLGTVYGELHICFEEQENPRENFRKRRGGESQSSKKCIGGSVFPQALPIQSWQCQGVCSSLQ